MRIVIFGATGMVGRGVLRECLRDPEVTEVVSVARTPSPSRPQQLREIVHSDFLDFSLIENQLANIDGCIFSIGITSTGTPEDVYTRVTYGFPVSAAKTLLKMNPHSSFVFVSGAGADSTGRSRVMWARLKGQAETALLAMPFRAVYVFRPGFIQPLHGIESRTSTYRLLYKLAGPFLTVFRKLLPNSISTTEELGQALLLAAKRGTGHRIVEANQIRKVLSELQVDPQQ